MTHTRFLAVLALSATAGCAQSSTGVSGPVTGFIFDAALGNIRPMVGIPGAAYIAPSVVATGVEGASIAPDGSAALVLQQNGTLVLYTQLRNPISSTALPILGAMTNADHFAWTADATAAAVYSSQTGQAQVLTALNSKPAVAATIDLSSLPGSLTALATDGRRILAGVATAGIYLITAGAPLQSIAASPSPSAVAISGTNLYFSDSQSQQIGQIVNYFTAPAPTVFSSDSGINAPVGIQVSADGLRLYSVNAGNQTLEVYDIASRTLIQTMALPFKPTRLDRFGDSSVFLMNPTGAGPLYVVRDSATDKAAVYFVPVPPNRRPLKSPVRRY